MISRYPQLAIQSPILIYLLTYLLTYFMEQSASWEANWSAASQEIPRILWNPQVQHRTQKRTPPVHSKPHSTSKRRCNISDRKLLQSELKFEDEIIVQNCLTAWNYWFNTEQLTM